MNEKWKDAAAKLAPELRPQLLELKRNYEEASAIHVPNYKGGPNAGILSELILMGWRKPVGNEQ